MPLLEGKGYNLLLNQDPSQEQHGPLLDFKSLGGGVVRLHYAIGPEYSHSISMLDPQARRRSRISWCIAYAPEQLAEGPATHPGPFSLPEQFPTDR